MNKKHLSHLSRCTKCDKVTEHISLYTFKEVDGHKGDEFDSTICLECHPRKKMIDIVMRILLGELKEQEKG